jgi:hypothetical protein
MALILALFRRVWQFSDYSPTFANWSLFVRFHVREALFGPRNRRVWHTQIDWKVTDSAIIWPRHSMVRFVPEYGKWNSARKCATRPQVRNASPNAIRALWRNVWRTRPEILIPFGKFCALARRWNRFFAIVRHGVSIHSPKISNVSPPYRPVLRSIK